MTESGNKLIRVLWPLLLHTGISCGAAMLAGIAKAGNHLPGAAGSILDGTDSALVTALTAAVSIPVFHRMWKKDRLLYPRQEKGKPSVLICAAAVLGGALASCIGSAFLEGLGIQRWFSNRVQEELFAADALVQIFGLGLIVPILEELLYRGVLYERLREFLTCRQAAAAAALIFALAHGNMIQFLYALPMALILHGLYEKSGSLKLPILFHMGANLISVFINLILH